MTSCHDDNHKGETNESSPSCPLRHHHHNSLSFRQTQAKQLCFMRRQAALILITVYGVMGLIMGMRQLSQQQQRHDESMHETDASAGLLKLIMPMTATTTTNMTKKISIADPIQSNTIHIGGITFNHTLVEYKNNRGNDDKDEIHNPTKSDLEDDYLSWQVMEEWGRRHARIWSPPAATTENKTKSSKLSYPWCTPQYTYGRARHDPNYMFDHPTGLIYVKMPKAASSTLAGLVHRIALRVGQRLQEQQQQELQPSGNHSIQSSSSTCAFRNQHLKQVGRWYGNRLRNASILMTSLRHPASRALSRVFFEMSFRKWPTSARSSKTQANILYLLQSMQNAQYGAISKGQGGFQLQYTTLTTIPHYSAWNVSEPDRVICPTCVQEHVQHVLNEYDVWMITERMEESIVLLQLLLHVQVGDLMVFSTNQGGKYFYQPVIQERKRVRATNRSKTTTISPHCLPLKKSFTTPAVQEYLQSREWRARNYGDYLLYYAVQASLNATIQHYTHPFQQALKKYRTMVQAVTMACRNQTMFPCSDHGQDQTERSKSNCYHDDEGCGYPCIDKFLLQYKQEKTTAARRNEMMK